MFKRYFLLLLTGYCLQDVRSQIDKFNSGDLHPVSPTAFQFMKYTEIPVSEYTGLPNISVPLYEISVDEVNIPLNLSYHAQGIRTSQEASWVGLGWDMQLGSIIQTINDRDDYGYDYNNAQAHVKRLPDFFTSAGDGNPTTLPMRYQYPSLTNGSGWTNPWTITAPVFQQGFAITHKFYVPVDGQFSSQEWDLFNRRWYDSEPDIFVASFMGHTLKFALDFDNNNSRKILNKRGYDVFKTTNGFEVVSPMGTHYLFEEKSVIKNKSQFNSIEVSSYGSPDWEDVSNIYFLSKIVTVHAKEILFEYLTTVETEGYPSYSDKFQGVKDATYNSVVSPLGGGAYLKANFYGTLMGNGTFQNWSTNKETYKYLKSITFPSGKIEFVLSDRSDITNGKKLDRVQLLNTSLLIAKEWQLNYSYFDATSITGNGYTYANGSTLASESRSALRLKLTGISQTDGGAYSFTYNSTNLPKKNSFAQDYWGYYNGKLLNPSMALNPTTMGYSLFGDNGVDRSPDINYVKAGMLEEVQYPTGGKTVFTYEFNQFNSSSIAGYPAPLNTIVPGAGLRIKEIATFDNLYTNAATRTTYSYEGGKFIQAGRFARALPYTRLDSWNINNFGYYDYQLVELSSTGGFSSSPFASINGVGYDKVIKRQVDGANVSLGKTETIFENYEDTYNPTIAIRALNCNIPTVKDKNHHENGSVISITSFDPSNNPVKKVENTYTTIVADLTYGARIMNYAAKYYLNAAGGYALENVEMNIIGYYPIFDINSLLTKTTTTDYQSSNTLVTTVVRTFDGFDQLSLEQSRSSSDEYLETYYSHPYDDLASAGASSLNTNHRYSEVIKARQVRRKVNYSEYRDLSEYKKLYGYINGRLVPTDIIATPSIGPGVNPTTTTFTQYDVNANPLEFTEKGTTNSLIWDYDNKYLTCEVKNATLSNIAFTSFEDVNNGGWTSSGIPTADAAAPTGRKVYSITNGSITKSGLTNGVYWVSYWKKGGSIQVNSGNGVAGNTKGLWTYYSHLVSVSGGTITVSGTGAIIDELRLYPKSAMMVTYTFQPFVGVTSKCDENNTITYYEYDLIGRLTLVRDGNKRIIKKICYNYANQVESCSFNATTQWQTTGNKRCQPCPSDNNYTTNVQEHEEIDVNPNSPTYNTTRWISDGVPGSCTVNCPQSCTPLNCTGNDKKCVNGVCETGVAIIVASTNLSKSSWRCTWKYCFSDGTVSTYSWNTTSSSACAVLSCH